MIGSQRATGSPDLLEGLPVLGPEQTLISLGPELSFPDLTAVADRLISGTLKSAPTTTRERLLESFDQHSGVPYIRNVRRAVEAARSPVWSRPETLLRLLIASAGLPEPRTNLEVAVTGDQAIIDIAWPEQMIAVEYDGHWHDRSPEQWARDAARTEALIDAGWLVVHVRATHLFREPHALVARLVRRLASRGFSLGRSIDLTRMPRYVP
ncbi:MAG: DUF559 domain-containing protein [Pseudolysinimonas sp.]